MAQFLDAQHVAVIYETITGEAQKRGVITTTEGVDLDAFLAAHPGLAVTIVPRSSLPGPDHNERHFREAVAAHTGAPYFPHGADRAVMVHPEGHVVSVHLGNVPGLDTPYPGHQLISHAEADVGDRWDGREFQRHYAAVHRRTGEVTHEYWASIDAPPEMPSTDHDLHRSFGRMRVGDVLKLKTLSVSASV